MAFSQHCADYKRYWNWVNNRNPERFELNKGYNYDGKNCCACIRLMTMAKELSEGQGLILDRSGIDRDYLLKVKNHQVTFNEVISKMDSLEESMNESFLKSTLPDEPDRDILEDILIQIRKSHYSLKSRKSY